MAAYRLRCVVIIGRDGMRLPPGLAILAAFVAAALALAGCARLPAPLATEPVEPGEPVGPAYHAGGGQWSDGAAVIILIRAFERLGRVGFCGARTVRSQTARTVLLTDYAANVAVLRLADDRIQQGLGMLPEARYRDDMTGVAARCYLTDRPWRAAYAEAAPEIRIARLQFNDDDGNGSGGGDTLVFRQTPVHRPLP
jgi:hypothetical protein